MKFMTVLAMVILLDGVKEYIAHVWSEEKISSEDCLNQKNTFFSLHLHKVIWATM